MAELEIDINMRIREWDVIQVKLTTFLFLTLLACEQAFQLGESREVTRQRHAKGDASQSFAARSRVLSRLAPEMESLLAVFVTVNPRNYLNLIQRDAILPKYQYFTDGPFLSHFSNCRKRAKN